MEQGQGQGQGGQEEYEDIPVLVAVAAPISDHVVRSAAVGREVEAVAAPVEMPQAPAPHMQRAASVSVNAYVAADLPPDPRNRLARAASQAQAQPYQPPALPGAPAPKRSIFGFSRKGGESKEAKGAAHAAQHETFGLQTRDKKGKLKYREADVKSITKMGYTRDQAITALLQNHNNVSHAIDSLCT
ncbi:hypothetical protein B484DRAFT_409352 [Ochromonadaceae sp. CCMP2298]|nr:hypothetical protein B484DRAFT_409352 [Ochromonadaceae sp. CCMP2298]|mmetsp:Transcript_22541/g.50109  ORF Transcript_22541/g.50109 Transcript_22541/m.50109 type:complete len:187 (-) Transcript_22541:151-711(-)